MDRNLKVTRRVEQELAPHQVLPAQVSLPVELEGRTLRH